MKYVKLIDTLPKLSNICLGLGSLGTGLSEAESFEILDAFADAGGNFADTANVYGKWAADGQNHSEIIIGKWLKQKNACGKITIATKGGHFDLKTPHISRVNKSEVQKDIEESLKSLGLDCIDLYWLHRDDETKPIAEILNFMEDFVKEGKIRHYGASNYRLDRLQKAAEYAKENKCRGFFAVQNQFSLAVPTPNLANSAPDLVSTDEALYRWHEETKTPLIPYSSTASGFFEKMFQAGAKWADRVNKVYVNERNLKIYGELLKLREKYNTSLYTLSVACLINLPFCTIPISSVRNVEQLEGFLEASDLTIEENLFEKYAF